MENTPQDLAQLRREFQQCRKLFTAFGDETRQDLLCVLLACDCRGLRSAELAGRTHLSRPAVSHHLQVLREAGVVKARKEGPASSTIWTRRTVRSKTWRACSQTFSGS